MKGLTLALTIGMASVTLFTWGRAVSRGVAARRVSHWPDTPEPDAWPTVSVIVPAWKERKTIKTCLSLLMANDYPAFEVIVAAGGPDGTFETAVEIARGDPRLHVIQQQPRGKNAALNDALPHARGDAVVFLDADSQIGPDWLRRMVAALCGGAGAVTGNYFPTHFSAFSAQGEMNKVLEYEVRGRVIVQGSGGIALRRSTLNAIGSFPEGAYSSDWDLDARLALGGFRRAFVPGAVTRSRRPVTLREWWKNEVRWRRLHLLSLFRLKSSLLTDPLATARHLYPYMVSWAVIVLTLLTVPARLSTRRAGRRIVPYMWAMLVGAAMAREEASIVEMYAYTRDRRWLPLGLTMPALTAAGWATCVWATLTTKKASFHFQGPREEAADRMGPHRPNGRESVR